jgi:hypothetical protein
MNQTIFQHDSRLGDSEARYLELIHGESRLDYPVMAHPIYAIQQG